MIFRIEEVHCILGDPYQNWLASHFVHFFKIFWVSTYLGKLG